ncbi:MAG: hypothetical protein M3R25_12900, partial [Bacteroidota bacterium]|nr:hypothetical protein [Bacteroidota bacterium]
MQILEKHIAARPAMMQQKYERINTYRNKLTNTDVRADSFQIIFQLTKEYQSFNYDTAYIEIQRLKKSATTTPEVIQADLQEAFILLSSGLFRESIDKLDGIAISDAPDSIRSLYYFYLARSHFDMADAYTRYLNNEVQFHAGMNNLDKAIQYSEINSTEQLSYRALYELKNGNRETSKLIYQKLIRHPDITTRQLAIEYSALSSLYQGVYQDSVLYFMIKAAIADEQALVMESTALTFLANYYANANLFDRASRYIDLALSDANFFGAQHRKMQILNIL